MGVRMLPIKYQKGVIEPLSLISLGFLVVSLIVGTFIVTNPEKTLDIRRQAKLIEECVNNSDCGPNSICTGGKCVARATRSTPTPTPQKQSDKKDEVSKETPAPTPYCTRFNQEDCLYGCEPTLTGGRCKDVSTTPSPTTTTSALTSPTPTPTAFPTPYCTRFNQEDCLYGCEPTLTGGRCRTTSTSTVTSPTPTPIISLSSPTPTPIPTRTPTPTPYCSRYYQEYCTWGCEADSSGGKCKPQPTPSPTPAPYSSEGSITRITESLKSVGQTCSNDFECESGNCQAAPGGRFCVPRGTTVMPVRKEGESCALTAYDRVCDTGLICRDNVCQRQTTIPVYVANRYITPSSPIPTPSSEGLDSVQEQNLIGLGRFLNTITFGTFGNYIATYAEVNAENPEATYLERAFSSEGLGASAQLGTVLTLEGAALYTGGAALAGAPITSIPLSTTVLPALNQASLFAYTSVSATIATAPSWVPRAIEIAGNVGTVAGTLPAAVETYQCNQGDLQACASGQEQAIAIMAGLQSYFWSEAPVIPQEGSFAQRVGQTITNTATSYMDEAQRAYAFDQNFVRTGNAFGLFDDESTTLRNLVPDAPPTTGGAGTTTSPTQITTASPPRPGSTVSFQGQQITLGEELGSAGAQGSVFLGQLPCGDLCAVKIFRTTPAEDAGLGLTQEMLGEINNFQLDYLSTFATREALESTRAPLPTFYGEVSDDAGNIVGYAMEYLQGSTAQQVLARQGGRFTTEQIDQVRWAAFNLQQTTGLPHGDLVSSEAVRFSNIFFTDEGRVILIDPAGTVLSGATEALIGSDMQRELNNLRTFIYQYEAR